MPAPLVLPSALGLCGLQERADLVSREALEAGSRGPGTGLREMWSRPAHTALVLAAAGRVRKRGVR